MTQEILLSNIQTLYDGSSATQAALRNHVDVILRNGRIESITPHNPSLNDSPLPRVDCTEYTVTPGLFDCHGHITSLGIAEGDLDRMNSQMGILLVERILYTTLVDGGVTSLRDVGGATHFMKRLVDEGIFLGPNLKIAICMLSSTGGHADFRGPDRCHAQLSRLWPEAPGRPSSLVDGPWECRKRVRQIVACGADLIKLCTSPGVASPSDKLENRDFSPEEIQAICSEAAERGLKVAAHAHSQNGIRMAIQCGVSDIQHISFMDEELVDLAHGRGCTVTPTSWIVNELRSKKGLDPFVAEKVKKVSEVHQKAVQYAAKGGLKILAGTDPVLYGMHGRNYLELVWLIREGLSPLMAWYGATGLAAEEIGMGDRGKIIPGNRADLLVCRGNVLESPERLGEGALIEVIKDGMGYRGGISEIPQKTFKSSVVQSLQEKAKTI